MAQRRKIKFVCDGKKCKVCKSDENGCIYTTHINHAINFKKNDDGSYVEDSLYLEDMNWIVDECKKVKEDNQFIMSQIEKFNQFLVEHGILSLDEIKQIRMQIYDESVGKKDV